MRWLALPLMVLVLAGLAYGLWPRGPMSDAGGLDAEAVATALAELDGGSAAESANGRGSSSRSVSFPRDHAAHPDAQGELWDLSAILRNEAGVPIAVQLRLARLGLRTEAQSSASVIAGTDAGVDVNAETGVEATKEAQGLEHRESAFAADAVFAGELLVRGATEREKGPLQAQRVSRAALGLAGAGTDGSGIERVWIEQWVLSREQDGSWVLRAEADGLELKLGLSPLKPPVVLDQEALAGAPSQAGEASVRFYSQSRLVASGRMRAGASEQALHGLAWLDHGWGALSEALAGGQGQLVANRFQLQLDDGSELACLHLRRRAGGGTAVPSCALIGVDGETLVLRRRDLTLIPIDRGWANLDGVDYPLGWQLVIPARELELVIEPLFDDAVSERISRPFADASRTWRGAVEISGWRGADAISGRGRMDLNGYGASVPVGT